MSVVAASSPGEGQPQVGEVWLRALDPEVLLSLDWDPVKLCFKPRSTNPVLGWYECDVADCHHPRSVRGLCTGCALWFERSDGDRDAFVAAGPKRFMSYGEVLCRVCRTPGHRRPALAMGLCRSCVSARRRSGLTADEFVDGTDAVPPAKPRPTFGTCTSHGCDRLAAQASTMLCMTHQVRWSASGLTDLDAFRRTAPVSVGDRQHRVSLEGVGMPASAQILFGIQACNRVERRLRTAVLSAIVGLLRAHDCSSLEDFLSRGFATAEQRRFVEFTFAQHELMSLSIETECAKDVWDLRAFGCAGGFLSFVGSRGQTPVNGTPTLPLRQPWLREALKAWAKLRLMGGIGPSTPYGVLKVAGMLSAFLDGHGVQQPDQFDRVVLELFLHHLRSEAADGEITEPTHIDLVRNLRRLLDDVQADGLTDAGGPLEGLPSACCLRNPDVPKPTKFKRDDEVGDALPDAVMMQLLDPAHVALLPASWRRLIVIHAEIGRRPDETCRLRFECLRYESFTDGDGLEVREAILVHDQFKTKRRNCRIPISRAAQEAIELQQADVRRKYPDTPAKDLVLFPRSVRNFRGTAPLNASLFSSTIREWADSLDIWEGSIEGSTVRPFVDSAGVRRRFDSSRVFPYAFRHTYAQRHVDAGVPVHQLAELMGHRSIETTQVYYRVRMEQKRSARDVVAAYQLSVRGKLTSSAIKPGLAASTLRSVAVPMGSCVEPANVSSVGRSCGIRHRCFGCGHFRTDPSFLPQLRDYLTELLVARETLATAHPEVADWVNRDAMPSDEEIAVVRRLIDACEALLADMPISERAELERLIELLRGERESVARAAPVSIRMSVRQPAPHIFPSVSGEAQSISES